MKTRVAPYLLSILLLLVVAFSLATTLEPWHQSWEGGRTRTDNLIQVALGDSRQLFARHFFFKADAYFHNGYYPTIYDRKDGYGQAHIAEQGHEGAEDEKELDFLGRPLDWIDAFSRNFFPSRHTHLGEVGQTDEDEAGHEHHDHHGHPGHPGASDAGGQADAHDAHGDGGHESGEAEGLNRGRHVDEREILPWLKLSLELDPKRVQTYTVAAFWLRTSLQQVDQAERLLRDGLREVPGDPELLLELGRVLSEDRKDEARARTVWELALKTWNEREFAKESPNFFLVAQLLGNLATLEEKAGHREAAIRHLERLSGISPNKDAIARWIETLRKE